MEIVDLQPDRGDGFQPGTACGSVAVGARCFAFTRARVVGRNGRAHVESTCERCNFRVGETPLNDFDRLAEEQTHAAHCEGPEAD